MKQTKRLLAGAYLSGVVFAALACPLLWLSDRHVTVELENETLFASPIRRAAAPYLAACSVLGASVGLTGMALSGWRETARIKAQLEAENNQLKRDLSSHRQELEDILLYNNRLQSMALDGFFADSNADETVLEAASPIPTATSSVRPSGSLVGMR
ncbi:MAG: hypothetical protein AAFY78_24265 [Cyanobacteria bacterium J06648_16]